MCHLDETPKHDVPAVIVGARELALAGAYAHALANAAERDEDAGLPSSWRRVHAMLFSADGLAPRIEAAAAGFGIALPPRSASVAYADEIRAFARGLARALAHGPGGGHDQASAGPA